MEDQLPMTEEQRAEAFREFQADHLRRQTTAQESIRNILMIWAILTAVGALLYVSAVAQGVFQ